MIGFMLLTRNALLRDAGGAPDFGDSAEYLEIRRPREVAPCP